MTENIQTQFIDLLTKQKIEQALELFQSAPVPEQQALFKALGDQLATQTSLNKIKTISVLQRTLKPSVTYQDFYHAWAPPTQPYYPFPVTAFNAQQLQKPEEVISIGLIQADIDTVLETWQSGFMDSDKQRAENIQAIANSSGQAHMYTVSGVYSIGKDD